MPSRLGACAACPLSGRYIKGTGGVKRLLPLVHGIGVVTKLRKRSDISDLAKFADSNMSGGRPGSTGGLVALINNAQFPFNYPLIRIPLNRSGSFKELYMPFRVFAGICLVVGWTIPSLLIGQDTVSSENLLPGTTRAWISVPDSEMLFDQIKITSLGKLAEKESMKPFVDQIGSQIKKYLDDQNMRLGITIDDLKEVQAAEICVAGVLPKKAGTEDKLVRGSHGLIILADVSANEENAAKLLKKIESEMESHGATRELSDDVLGAKVSKWKLPIKENQYQRYSYHTLESGWLIASDNDLIFRDVIRRLKTPDTSDKADSLANNEAFKRIAKETSIDGVVPHLRWYVDPFGYIELAQAIADEELEFKQRRNDHAAILRKEGFDALRGIGGILALNQAEQDLVHRSFVFATPPNSENLQGQRAISMLDFRNKWNYDLVPEPFVTESTASYLTFTWDMQKAYQNVGPILDAFLGEKSFEKMEESFRTQMNVDLTKLIGFLGNRISVISDSKRPIDERSERVAIVVPINDQADTVYAWVKKLVGGDGDVLVDAEREYIRIPAEDGLSPEFYDDPIFNDPEDKEKSDDAADDDTSFKLFEKRFVLVERGFLIIANDWDFIKELMDNKLANLAEQDDFKLVNQMLEKLADPKRVSAREFGRIDRMVEANYEMMRQGKMASSQTSLARILNQMFKTKEEPSAVRQQKIDGTKLPENYAEEVAPYLGPSGWISESLEDGWLFSGCILKKKGPDELVKNPEIMHHR